MKQTFSKWLSWMLVVAMVFSLVPSSLSIVAKAAETSYKLYFALPAETTAADWAINAWGDDVNVQAAETTIHPEGWQETDNFPALLADEENPGFGYATVTGKLQGLQIVNAKAEKTQYNESDFTFVGTDVTTAYSSLDNKKWFKDAALTQEIAPAVTPEAEEDVDPATSATLLTDLVQVKIGDEIRTMPIAGKGFYELKVAGDKKATEATEATEKDVTILVNGESVDSKKVSFGAEDVYVRFADGKLTTNSDWEIKNLAIVGDFDQLTYVDADGTDYTIGNWAPADPKAEMTYIGNGMYSKTLQFKNVAEDTTLQYKVCADDSWDNANWGDSSVEGGNVSMKVPAGTKEVTIIADSVNQKVYDTINTTPYTIKSGNEEKTLIPFVNEVSLIGTVRGDEAINWDNKVSGWEFNEINEHVYAFSSVLKAGQYDWKVVYDFDAGNDTKGMAWSDFDNKSISLAKDTYVTFVYDAAKDKIYDSVNDKAKAGQLLGFKTAAAKQEVVRNANDTLVFVASPEAAEKVSLVYGVYDEEKKSVADEKKVDLKKNTDGSFSSNELYFGDAKTDIAYYYVIDGKNTLDTSAETTAKTEAGVEYSIYSKPKFEGRYVSLPGTVNANAWAPAKETEKLTYKGNGLYFISYDNIAPGNYEYKIAIDGTWAENYGANGTKDGPNMPITVTEAGPLTFTYNDISHLTVNSIDYIFADISLSGTNIPEKTMLSDDSLRGIYSVTLALKAGAYNDVKYGYNQKEYEVTPFTLTADKNVTFYFDPVTEIYYNNASDVKVETSNIKYDSKDIEFKKPYGAIATGKDVTFQIQTGTDASSAKLVVKGKERKTLDMTEVKDAATDTTKKWTVTTNFEQIGEYDYFFVVSNGSDVVVYSDDEKMNYGVGMTTDLTGAIPYDLIVYKDGFKTPDWMKNAVVYQIFPDRFYNGDKSNDQAQTSSRGATDYEYIEDWSTLPENPDREAEDKDAYAKTGAWVGDGNWSNEIYGGDVQGIIDKIDYLKELGVNVIYLNPIVSSISSHRYDASDYSKLDPILGDMGDFEKLAKVAKENGMHIILDGVFNHVADDSIYFDRYYKFLEKGTTKVGAYPYWAYVYDAMNEDKNLTQEDAEQKAKTYFKDTYGITDFTYTKWFDIKNEFFTEGEGDAKKDVVDTIGQRKGKGVYSYDCWWGYDSMPVIISTNGSEYQTPGWKEEIIGTEEKEAVDDGSITKYWLTKGSNGWRLDVANEVSDETWQHFRKSVKALNDDNVIIGEIWTDAVEYLLGDMYDSVMNYMFRNAVIEYVKDGDLSAATDTLERLRERYPTEAWYAMMNLVASHDTTRILSYLDGITDDRDDQKSEDTAENMKNAFPSYETTSDKAKQLQYVVAFLQMTYAGAPTIYYGDEIGMTGADDPDDRRAFTWGKGNKEIVEWYATMAKIRNEYATLRTGAVESFDAGNDAVMAYVRSDKDARMTVFANNSEKDVEVTFDAKANKIADGEYVDLVNNKSYTVADGSAKITIPAYRGVILVEKAKAKDIKIDTTKLAAAYDEDAAKKADEEAIKKHEAEKKAAEDAKKAAEEAEKNKPSQDKNAKTDKKTETTQNTTQAATTTQAPSVETVVDGQKINTANFVGSVVSAKDKTVALTGLTKKQAKKSSITIPNTVIINNETYQVTKIDKKAYSGNKKLKKVVIGANVTEIAKNAFAGCKNLKTVIIKSTKLKKVGKNAFKGTNKKIKIQVPKKQLKKYRKLLKKGLPKTAKFKAI